MWSSRTHTLLHQLVRSRLGRVRSEAVSDSSQGSGTPKPSPAKAPPVPPRGVSAPIRPKAPAMPAQGVRPLAPSSLDHSVPEARRAREPMPEDATVPMRRSEHPPSMPAEDGWTAGSADITAQIPRDAPSPKPAPVIPGGNTSVVTDASALRAALQEVLEPMQHALDDLTVKIARERVDRKEAIERLERTVARVATANPPPVAPAATAAAPPAPAPKAPPVQNTPFAPATNFAPITSPFAATNAPAREAPAPAAPQPYSVSPSAAPPPVAPVATASPPPLPTAKPASPAPPPVAAAAPIAVHVPAVVTPSTIPVKIDFDYSTDLNFELPPGLDMGKRRRRMAWFVFIVIVGGAIAMLVSTLISQSRGPGAL